MQPSLSLDNASNVEVFLLKNEGEFVSVEQGQKLGSGISMGDKKKKREENMRQLLDVTNTITSEEMRDFEMRYAIQSTGSCATKKCMDVSKQTSKRARIHLKPIKFNTFTKQ